MIYNCSGTFHPAGSRFLPLTLMSPVSWTHPVHKRKELLWFDGVCLYPMTLMWFLYDCASMWHVCTTSCQQVLVFLHLFSLSQSVSAGTWPVPASGIAHIHCVDWLQRNIYGSFLWQLVISIILCLCSVMWQIHCTVCVSAHLYL